MTAASVSCGVVGVGPSGREAPRRCTADLHPFLACGSSDRRREVSLAGVRVLADPAPKNNKALRWFVLVDGVGGPGWRLVGAETRRLPVRWGIPPESRPEGRKGGGATPHCPAHRRCVFTVRSPFYHVSAAIPRLFHDFTVRPRYRDFSTFSPFGHRFTTFRPQYRDFSTFSPFGHRFTTFRPNVVRLHEVLCPISYRCWYC